MFVKMVIMSVKVIREFEKFNEIANDMNINNNSRSSNNNG
jgi:hypothetical protein